MKKRAMKTFPCLLLLAAALALTPVAGAADVSTEVKVKIAGMLKKAVITAVNPSPLDGVYEVIVDNKQIIYVNPVKGLIIAGQIYSADGRNLTGERLKAIYTSLAGHILQTADRSKAIKIGNGPVDLFEFTDVDCPFCRQSEQYFRDKNAYFSRYIFLTPLVGLHPASEKKTMLILNSENPAEAYLKAIGGAYDDKLPEFSESAKSKETYRYLSGLLQQYGIKSTPTMVWSEGFAQGLDAEGLNRTIARIKTSQEKSK